jgi:hypothetical protein
MLIHFIKISLEGGGGNENILGFFTRKNTLLMRIYKDCEGWLKIEHNKGSMLKGLRLEVEITLIEKHLLL